MHGLHSPSPQECEQLRASSGDSPLKFCSSHKDRTWVKEPLYEQEEAKLEIFQRSWLHIRGGWIIASNHYSGPVKSLL